MKSRMIGDVKWIFVVMVLILIGCSRPVVKPGDGSPLTVSQVSDLEAQVGLVLPSDVVILNSGDGGGRDASYEYYFWVLGSTNQMVSFFKIGRNLNASPQTTTEMIEGSLQKRKILNLTNSYSVDWVTNGYQFSGWLGRSIVGDYLIIKRMKY